MLHVFESSPIRWEKQIIEATQADLNDYEGTLEEILKSFIIEHILAEFEYSGYDIDDEHIEELYLAAYKITSSEDGLAAKVDLEAYYGCNCDWWNPNDGSEYWSYSAGLLR